MNYPETVTEFLTHVNGKVYSVCEVFYTIYLKDCTKPQEAAEQLRTFLENCLAIPSDYTLMVEGKYSEEEVGKTIGEIKPIPTQLVQNLMDKSPAEDQFYLELWTQMCNKTLFPNELTMVSAIIVLMYMPKIPYFCLPQVPTMEDEVYQECTRHVQEQIKRAIYAIEAGYPQKTQLAVQLMRLCNQIKGEKEKTVFIAQILGYYQGQIKQLMDSQKKEKSPNARQDDSGTE